MAFLLAPLFFDTQITQRIPLLRSLAAFGLFCLLSSAVYLINDIYDIEADRQHPEKRNRPIASGKLPIKVAVIAIIILVIICLGLGYLLSPWLAVIMSWLFAAHAGLLTLAETYPLDRCAGDRRRVRPEGHGRIERHHGQVFLTLDVRRYHPAGALPGIRKTPFGTGGPG